MKTLPTLVSVVVRTSAKGSLAQAGVGVELRELLRDIFREQFDVDSLKEGDQIRLFYDTMYFRGQEMGSGDILGAEIVRSGKTWRAYYYDKGDGTGGYYNYEGEPLKSENANGSFVYMPLQNYTRVSSPYGIRVHPILHTVKMHTGIDYAAPTGTPVYAPADGTISFKGWKGGYGHTVVMEHGGGVETIYGHLSAFSPAAGRVRAGEVIGFVGTSGRSTARTCTTKPVSTASTSIPPPSPCPRRKWKKSAWAASCASGSTPKTSWKPWPACPLRQHRFSKFSKRQIRFEAV
ncbi:M23 family metallopeptidase [Kingella potus]|uniref:M23 family metallopeptidase n=1 Tax=Kingella potus TaxID=265175 RepID=UPI003CC7CF15